MTPQMQPASRWFFVRLRRNVFAGYTVLLTVLAISAGVLYTRGVLVVACPIDRSSAMTGKVLATVNGDTITTHDLTPLLQMGMDPAVALDRYINRLLASQRARAVLPVVELNQAMRSAERDALAQLFLTHRGNDLSAQLAHADIERWYGQHFDTYAVRYFLTGDPAEAKSAADGARAKDATWLAKFLPMPRNGQPGTPNKRLTLAEIPYDMGHLFATMKVGEVTAPQTTRHGIFVLLLDDITPAPAPTPQTLDQVRLTLTNERLTTELNALRGSSTIVLHQ